ncbi:MAG: winged helix-turn-helix transcriptional regulator [Halobacteriales archaeon]|nr:winged helix-turn-helix transcriptional regulator [Halobacteriales archaeon]
MTVRAALIALIVLLACAPLAAAQGVHTPIGDVVATVERGDAPVGADVERGDGVGDSSVTLRQSVREAGIAWRGAPGPVRLDAEVGLRGLVVRSPILPMLGALLAHEGDLLPAGAPWPYLGPDGIDLTYDVDGHARHAGDGGWPAFIWPDTWYGIGAGAGYDGARLPMLVDRSSDWGVQALLGDAAYVCRATGEQFALGLGDACQDRSALALRTLPALSVVSELPGVAAHVLGAQAPASPPLGLGEAMPAARALPDVSATPPGFRAPGVPRAPGFAADAPVVPPSAAAAPASDAPLSTQSSAGVAWSLPPLQDAAPAVLGVVALLAPIWALYRRLTTPDALIHPLREDMLSRIRAHPGIHESQLAREMGLRHTHVQYHLRVLRQSRIVEERRFGGLKCLFEVGKLSEAEKGHAMNLRGRGPEVLQGIVVEPGITQRDLARKLGMSESSVKWHLDRLTQAGMVRTDRARGSKRAWPEPMAAAKPAVPAVPVVAALPVLALSFPLPPAE